MSTPDPTTLTRASRRAITYYREMAEAVRRSAAIERAQADHLAEDDRLAAMTKADRLDADAQRWGALADELAALGEERAERHPDQGALL